MSNIENNENIEIKITELEKSLTYAEIYDFDYVFEILKTTEEKITGSSRDEIISKKIESVKMLTTSELILKFSSIDITNLNFNFDLNQIDKFFGTNFRIRLVKKFVDSNVKLPIIQGTLTEQLANYINWFLNLISTVNITKFPESWEIYYSFFVCFKNQLKTQINTYLNLANSITNSVQSNQSMLSNIRTICNFESQINNILQQTKSNHKLSIDDSLINLFENSLIWFIDNVKKDLASITAKKIEEFGEKVFVIPNTNNAQIDSYKIIADDVTANLIAEFKKCIVTTNKYSTGKIYSAVIKEVFLQLKTYVSALHTFYTVERKKQPVYKATTEYLMFNIIFNVHYCTDMIKQISEHINGKIQVKYIPNAEFAMTTESLTKSIEACISVWTTETCAMFSEQFGMIANIKFDERNDEIVKKTCYEYSKSICVKYVSACKRVFQYLPDIWAHIMTEKITFNTIDLFCSHLLKLRCVSSVSSKHLDLIVDNMFQATNKVIYDKQLNGEKQIDMDGEIFSLKSVISSKITQIRTIINAIAVENSKYNETIHNNIFCQGYTVSYNTIASVKGCITMTNIHKVTANTINNSANNVVEGGMNMADKLTKLVTGKDDSSSHGSSNNSVHGTKESNMVNNNDDDSQHTFMSNMADVVDKTKKMIGGINDIKNMKIGLSRKQSDTNLKVNLNKN